MILLYMAFHLNVVVKFISGISSQKDQFSKGPV